MTASGFVVLCLRQDRLRMVILLASMPSDYSGHGKGLTGRIIPRNAKSRHSRFFDEREIANALIDSNSASPERRAGRGNGRVWKAWKAMKPASHPCMLLSEA
jgi:hypothetical protein